MSARKQGRASLTQPQAPLKHKTQKTNPQQPLLIDCLRTDPNPHFRKAKSQAMRENQHQRNSIETPHRANQTCRTTRKKSAERSQPGQSYQAIVSYPHQHYLFTEKSAELRSGKKGSVKRQGRLGEARSGQRGERRSGERVRAVWNEKNLPVRGEYVLQHYGHYLTRLQREEIREYKKKVYYIGHRAKKRESTDPLQERSDSKDYLYVEHDHVAYRYQLLGLIGKGSYGQVFRAHDHKQREDVALKIIKNDPKFSKQAFVEIKILSHIKENDEEGQSNVVKIRDFVMWRKHVCIVFQLLSDNLYELIIRNNYEGLSEELIRRFAIQLLISLEFLGSQGIIHCDLKPENILLKQHNKSGIKLIDFGSSCFQHQTLYTYIQSRYYRAPQITLGLPYGRPIDAWSTGCILAELHLGVPLFPGQNEHEQMKYMTDTLGIPPKPFLSSASRSHLFFDSENSLIPPPLPANTMDMFSKPLRERIADPDFLSFIQCFLQWDADKRVTPMAALAHPWVTKGLPEQLKHKFSSGGTSRPHHHSQPRFKPSKSREKGSSAAKLSGKGSQQRLKRPYMSKR